MEAVGTGLEGRIPEELPIARALDPFETTNNEATTSTTKSDGTSLNPLPRPDVIRIVVHNHFARDEAAAKD